MSRKTIKGFAELRTLLKKTETESEAKAILKGGEVKLRRLPVRPDVPPAKDPRSMSVTDKFIVDTLAIQLDTLPLEQLYDARITIQDAMECANASMVSIGHQLESKEDHLDPQGRSWRPRAEAALRFKVQEGKMLQKRLTMVDEMIARMKPQPPLKLVPPPPPPMAYEILTDVPLPSPRQSSDEWRKYPFEKLETPQHSFRFAPGMSANEVRRLITAAQRHTGKHFAYRTMPDGIIAVWRTEGPSRGGGMK
jgi:hypothetical protein